MAPPLKERGIKMSSVIDQSDDSEFIPEPLARADAWYQRYLSVMGGAPQEEENIGKKFKAALDVALTPALKRSFDLAKRAMGRDQTPANRAPEVQLTDFPADSDLHDLLPGELAFPKYTYGVALKFILRRCEVERLRWEDLQISPDSKQVTVHIRKSKTDQAAKGTSRTLGCTCRTDPSDCPVEMIN